MPSCNDFSLKVFEKVERSDRFLGKYCLISMSSRLLADIASRITSRTGEKGVLSRLHRQFAAAVQAGNASCVLETHGRQS